jgi:carbon monoxide dehydrogenase subunit G
MIIEETFTIDAPVQRVWDFFLDINQMSKCVPGAEVKQLDASTYEGTLSVKVGPIGASFGGSVTITSQSPPSAIEAAVNGKDKQTGSMVQGKFASTLKSLAADQTEVSYQIDVAIRGRLGQFGQTVIQDTAKRISAEFLSCVKAQIETPEGEAPPPLMTQQQAGSVAGKAFLSALLAAIRDWIRRFFEPQSRREHRE